jgi:transposase
MPDAAMGTPFGPRIHAIATYLKTFQTLSYERLQGAFSDLFGLTISQGGLMNMLRRAQKQFVSGRDDAVSQLRLARVVSSDETGVRIEGSNSYHWVFRSDRAVVHTAAPTRGAIVVRTMMDGHRPDVWCSDRYVAQQGHADAQQACLAHLARDVAYAIENGDDFLPMRLKLWLEKAFGLAKGIRHLAPSTIAARRRALHRTLGDILAASTSCDFARVIQKKFARASNQLLTFADWPGQVEPTNNACERSLRPAVIQRKVTNGYRAMWAAEGEADVRTVVDTARLAPGANIFGAISATLGAA